MRELALTLYTKPDCPLCEEMEKAVKSASAGITVTVERVDITSDVELLKKYGMDIPLLFHGAEQLAKHRAHEKTLSAKLRKLAVGSRA